MDMLLSAVGFDFDGQEEYVQLGTQLIENGEAIPTSKGTYYCWSALQRFNQKIELWTKRDLDGEMQMIKAYYHGAGTAELEIKGRIERRADIHHGGCFRSSFDQDILGGEAILTVPLIFECPDFDCYDQLQLPARKYVRLCGLAVGLKCYGSVEEFRAADHDPDFWDGPESLVPSDYSKAFIHAESPIAYITGRVVDADIITNPVTGKEFSWAVVEAPVFGQVNVVASPQALEGYLVRDGVVDGTIWLSGRFDEESSEDL